MLTTRERAVVAAIAEAFFPAREPIGIDGNAAGAVSYVDRMLSGLALPLRIQLRCLLLAFEVGTALTSRGALFSAVPLDERVARLQAWERADHYTQRALYSALRWIFTLAYLADPEVQRRIGMPESDAHPPAPVRRPGAPRRLRRGPRVKRLERRFNTDQLVTGIEIPQWLRLLAGARFRVSARYLHRIAWITGWSTVATTSAPSSVAATTGASHRPLSIRPRSSSSDTGAAVQLTCTTSSAATRTTRIPLSTKWFSLPRSSSPAVPFLV
ncbi:gluconate 2-dehydrogenase subunit 3 family protein [Mycobacterium paragordonae]|uniref:gluconate 2-dehydrogenase subunit 3 family protein n=1 Tax=Mycobacterium paragordonae TaxID=1389713 RepID=UPI000ABD922E|nr:MULTISPECIES: gluconate 2-dehydrogenase subunit 3 family protein [Mycobacterium]